MSTAVKAETPGEAAAAFGCSGLRTPVEERRWTEKFGDKYRDYMERTGRFFPRLPP
jgi:protein-S-isoprenylcysteine O-methyltransferase Ste14